MNNVRKMVLVPAILLGGVFLMGQEMPGCAPPHIETLDPDGEVVGGDVNILGSGFLAEQGASKIVFYPDIDAGTANVWSAGLINIDVPEGAKDGYVYVLVEGKYSNPVDFDVIVEEPGCLPDTGQDKCYDVEGNEITCGSGYAGQDAEYDTGCQPSYTDNGDETVTDECTGLMWQQEDDDTARTWANALLYCENLGLAGYTDWRLPNSRELESIVDAGRSGPAINTDYFPGTDSSQYWTSSTNIGSPPNVWCVGFGGGYTNGYYKTHSYYTRCVR